MNREQIIFFVTGLIAGLVSVSVVFFGPPAVAIMSLTIGVGPLFFLAVVVGTVSSGASRHFHPGLVRYFGGLVLCTTSYFAGAVMFWWVGGLSSQWLGFKSSANIGHFGIDVWLGLIAAGTVSASGITLFAALLTRRWSKALLWRLMLAGLLTLVVTFIANLPFQTDWSFLGLLFPIGTSLFCYLVGTHILRHAEVAIQEIVST